MRQLSEKERQAAKGLLLGLQWEGESWLVRRAVQWAQDHQLFAEKAPWTQWEGLRRQGEGAAVWGDYIAAVDDWLSEPADAGGGVPDEKRVARRAWNERGLKDSLLLAIEDSSKPPDGDQTVALRRLFEEGGFSERERNEIDQLLRVRRGRKFVELLTMKVKTIREAKCLASIL